MPGVSPNKPSLLVSPVSSIMGTFFLASAKFPELPRIGATDVVPSEGGAEEWTISSLGPLRRMNPMIASKRALSFSNLCVNFITAVTGDGDWSGWRGQAGRLGLLQPPHVLWDPSPGPRRGFRLSDTVGVPLQRISQPFILQML